MIGTIFGWNVNTSIGKRGSVEDPFTRRLTYDSNHFDLYADNFLPLNVRSALPLFGGITVREREREREREKGGVGGNRQKVVKQTRTRTKS